MYNKSEKEETRKFIVIEKNKKKNRTVPRSFGRVLFCQVKVQSARLLSVFENKEQRILSVSKYKVKLRLVFSLLMIQLYP